MNPLTRLRFTMAGAACALSALGAAGAIGAGAPTAYADDAQALPATCVVHSLPAFIAQGEFATTGTVADIIEVECDPETYGTKARMRLTDQQLYLRCEGNLTWYVPNSPYEGFFTQAGSGVSVELDPDGNATVALLAGPNCTPGETLVGAHMEQTPFESFTSAFAVLPPQTSPVGVAALPADQVEDAYSSAFATIIQAELPAVHGEQTLRIGSEELYHRCRVAPHLRWIAIDRTEVSGVPEVTGVPLDNDGNGFVIVIGDASCASGSSLIEADLEAAPFTTLTTTFTIEPPQPTAEPGVTIEKLQEIQGSGAGLTAAPLKGALGQTVDYLIAVKNTSKVAETLGPLVDPHCDPGTIAGGPGLSTLRPGETVTYTCEHRLSAVGTYANEATITASTVGGFPLTRTSNQVLVEVPAAPAFTVEKRQRIAGSGGVFTSATLIAASGQTVEYQITVKNTGNVPLVFSGFSDERCDAGTIAGGSGEAPVAPGQSATFTCSHLLTSTGPYVNVARLTATPPGEGPLSNVSNQVVTEVPASPAAAVGPALTNAPAPEKPLGGVKPCPRVALVMRGGSGPKRRAFVVRVASTGLRQVTVYLDGRRIKTWRPSSAKSSAFSVKINPRGLPFGGHRVLAKPAVSDRACGASAVTHVFVFEHARRPLPAG